MAYKTNIEWTQSSWSPITGCSRISPGCSNCYAERLAATRLRNHPSRKGLTDANGLWNGEVRINREWIHQPIHWRKSRRVFVVAHGDLFHENVPVAWIAEVFAVMAYAHQHVYQVLTKRPDRMQGMLSCQDFQAEVWDQLRLLRWNRGDGWYMPPETRSWPLPNVWLGTSVEDQKSSDERIPYLLKTPATVRWISAEPLLEFIDLTTLHHDGTVNIHALTGDHGLTKPFKGRGPGLDWVVAGGESGPNHREMNPDWAARLKWQCQQSGVPFFMKQMSGKKPIPPDLLVREYPQ